MSLKINASDLMIINRAIAHDNVPREKAFFIDDEGKYVPYLKRQVSVTSAKDTKKDIEVSCNKMLRDLGEHESKRIRGNYASDKSKDRHLKIVIELVTKYSTHEQLSEYCPNLLKLL